MNDKVLPPEPFEAAPAPEESALEVEATPPLSPPAEKLSIWQRLGDRLPAPPVVGALHDDLPVVVRELGDALVDDRGELALRGDLVGAVGLVGRGDARRLVAVAAVAALLAPASSVCCNAKSYD